RFEEPEGEVEQALETRMLLSVLADADYLDTESHFARTTHGPKVYRQEGPALDIERAITALDKYCESNLRKCGIKSMDQLRAEVLDSCIAASGAATGVFTLTAP